MNARPAIADLGERPAWRVGGERPLAFLHDMLTADLAALEPGRGRDAAFLTDKGRVRAIVRVLALAGGEALVDADPEAAHPVAIGLARLAPLGRAEMTPEPRRLLRVLGDSPLAPAGAASGDHAEIMPSVLAVRIAEGIDLLCAPDAVDEVRRAVEAAGAVATDAAAVHAARIRAARPVFGLDVTADSHVNETPLLGFAVAFDKGCYPGQESVARIRNLGSVRRRLVPLVLHGVAQAPEPGTLVAGPGGSDAGRVTSSGADERGVVAFAIVDAAALDAAEKDAGALTVGGAPATLLV